MPSIRVSQETYKELQERMGKELEKRVKKTPSILRKGRIGISFDEMIRKLLM